MNLGIRDKMRASCALLRWVKRLCAQAQHSIAHHATRSLLRGGTLRSLQIYEPHHNGNHTDVALATNLLRVQSRVLLRAGFTTEEVPDS